MRIDREIIILLVILSILAFSPLFFHDNPYVLHFLIMCLIWSSVVAAWDLIVGYAGIFSFGQLAFFTIGAYAAGMASLYLGVSPWLGILAGGLLAGLVGVLLGVACLNLKGVYMALVTFGLHLVLAPLLTLGRPIGTGGSRGLLGIPELELGGYCFSALEKVPWFYTILVISFLSFFFIFFITRSSYGLAFRSLRDAEPFARSLGVNGYKYKVVVFGISAFITGIIGAFYAFYVSSVSPRMLGLDTFLMVMIMLIIGGVGRFPRVLAGVLFISLLNEFLRPVEQFRSLIFGAVVIFSIILMPQGLIAFFENKFFQRKKNLAGGKKKLKDTQL